MYAYRAVERHAGRCSQLVRVLQTRICRPGQSLVRAQSTTDQAQTSNDVQQQRSTSELEERVEVTKKPKTQAQLDEELRQKLSAIAGDGGEAGVEYEDGKPVAMKRSVQQNMFRYI